MLAVTAARFHPEDPLSALELGERPEPEVPDGWTAVTVKAASLNQHDLWSLRGVGLREDQLPMILGCDAAGIDEDGNEVVLHTVISDPDWIGDENMDPKRRLLSEQHPGTFAEQVAVPRRNLLAKPVELTFEEAACLPTAWLTAYRMLFTRGQLAPGSTVLIQGAGGGVGTALISLASASGIRVWTTDRSADKRERTLGVGAEQAFEPGARLPERVDAVMDTVGAATWDHSINSLKRGGTLVSVGATSGLNPDIDISKVFLLERNILGSTMGTRDEFERLLRLCVERDIRPPIDSAVSLTEARSAFEALAAGQVFGKVVLTV